jgi:RNA polymerase subunit RPABC4/transcription elongation factor Spt4
MVGHIKNILESHGINCVIQRQYGSAATGEIPPRESWPELWIVNPEKIERAKEIVNEALNPKIENLPSWECKKCHEIIEGQFTACWNCEAEKEELI